MRRFALSDSKVKSKFFLIPTCFPFPAMTLSVKLPGSLDDILGGRPKGELRTE